MAKDPKAPVTMAVRFLRERGEPFGVHLYRWEKKGARGSAEALGVPLAAVIKTLVFETDEGAPLLVLMDGEHEVSAKALARHLGARAVRPADPARAEALTGYQVGGISPFGTRAPLPVIMAAHLLALETAYINGGRRGFLVSLPAARIRALLDATPAEVTA